MRCEGKSAIKHGLGCDAPQFPAFVPTPMDDHRNLPDAENERGDCPHLEDLPAWLQGELDRETSNDLAAHVLTCAACAEEKELLSEILSTLNGPDRHGASSSARAAESAPLVRRAFATVFSPRALGAPAAICLGVFISLLVLAILKLSPPTGREVSGVEATLLSPIEVREAHNEAIAWLLRQQESDGSFAGWPLPKGTAPLGRARLTRFALLSLASASDVSPPLLLAIERARSFLETERASIEERELDDLAQQLIQHRFLKEPAPTFAEALLAANPPTEADRALLSRWSRLLVTWQRELEWISAQSEAPLTDIPTRLVQRGRTADALRGSLNPPAMGPRAGDRFLATALFALSCAEVQRR